MLDIPRIREDFPALQHGIYLQTAGVGMNSRQVLAEITDRWQYFFEQGPWLQTRRDERFLHKQRTREALARFFNVPTDTIAMVNNVSNSMSLVVSGLSLEPGDEIITTNEEDDALWLPLYNIGSKRHGAVVRHMTVGATPTESIANFEALLSPRTKLVAISHVVQDTGTELPVAEITRLARERGAYVYLDGGQAVGQLKVDISAIDPDFYAVLGYKWMLGPYGTGCFYVAERMRDVLDISWTGSHVAKHIDFETGAVEWEDYPRRLEMGSVNFPTMAGLGAAVEYLESHGIEAIEARSKSLSRWLRGELLRHPKVVCYDPEHPDAHTGIVAYGVEGVTGEDLAAYLHENEVWCRSLSHGNMQAVRLCTAFINSEEEIERAIAIMAAMPR
jgi:cysteine desulfurase/selenocysteine lyase